MSAGFTTNISPQNAVRHDSEKIPLEVAENIEWARTLLAQFESLEEKKALIDRVRRFFVKERKVAEQSIAQLDQLTVDG